MDLKKIEQQYLKYPFSKLTPIYWQGDIVYVLDQLLLPQKEKFIKCRTYHEIARVIKDMNIRGAPAIGVAAAMGFALGIKSVKQKKCLKASIKKIIEHITKTRPTAKNLTWALQEQKNLVDQNPELTLPELFRLVKTNSMKIHIDDIEMCKSIGNYGAKLMKRNFNILTHCNAGALATGDYGTALGVIRAASARYKGIHVYVDETRPYLQGSRLTAYELMKDKINYTLICDNMAGSLMAQGKINAIVIGADRIAGNGDVANKIGSYPLAVLAKYHKIPFYVAAPHSTFDLSIRSGKDIPIEERAQKELIIVKGQPIAHKDTRVYNPAFDVVPNKLITAIITEKGILRKPYKKNIQRIFP